jgi:F-box protein 18 (helicase)
MKYLYIAFNKSVQVEAQEKFPSNVTCRTSHALAFRAKGFKHKDRLVPGLKANIVMEALALKNYEDARFTIDTLTNYLISPDAKVSRRHISSKAQVFYREKQKKCLISLSVPIGSAARCVTILMITLECFMMDI